MTDEQLLETIRANMRLQDRNHPDTKIATDARRANRPLFEEAAKRGLDSNKVQQIYPEMQS